MRALGAEKVIRYRERNFVEETLAWTNAAGVDLALDLVGGRTFYQTFGAVRFYGRMVTMLGPDPKYADWQPARLRGLTVSFYLMFSPGYFNLVDHQKRQTGVLERAAELFEKRKLSVKVEPDLSSPRGRRGAPGDRAGRHGGQDRPGGSQRSRA